MEISDTSSESSVDWDELLNDTLPSSPVPAPAEQNPGCGEDLEQAIPGKNYFFPEIS